MRRQIARFAHLLTFATCVPGYLDAQVPPRRDLVLATTTSLYDTGLLDSLGPIFERETGHHLRVVAVGSGQALRMGERGDADVLLVHSPAAEQAFVAAGRAGRRLVVASNYFTIVGPPDDPAGVREAPSAAAALKRIADAGTVFVSRGDSSGTHQRELELWRDAGGRPSWTGYLESGQGMSLTLLIADERRGYTLTDRSTLGSLRRRVRLAALRERERALLNVYHVIEVNPAARPRVNADGARAFADWIVSGPVQDLLAHFGESRLGEPLFIAARGREPAP
ncbi:MAG: substrate-binding domain-containing protein [Gemmatimonadetes bacterium]|nr:substrate-binding domain-containing protein [Gemmatimonadota bacterium]